MTNDRRSHFKLCFLSLRFSSVCAINQMRAHCLRLEIKNAIHSDVAVLCAASHVL